MKPKFIGLGIIAAIVVSISIFFVGCGSDLNDIVIYRGQVVYINTTTPFPDLTVKVTDGQNTHCQTQTDAGGNFSLKVRVREIDGSYYLLAGDSTCLPKKVSLGGYGNAEVDLGVIEVEGPGLPTVSTKSVTDVSDRGATSGGNVTADGRVSVTARGVCWSKSEYPTIDDEHTINGSGLGEFNSRITNIEAGATYYVRAYATNRIGTAYGDQKILSVKTGLPEVTTDEVRDISNTSAICGGTVSSAYALSSRGVCWSSFSATPTIEDEHTIEIATTGHFTSLMIGLKLNTTYYVRAYAVNEKGIGYGEAMKFTTLAGLPSVSTSDVTNIQSSTATCGGWVIDDGGFEVLERGVCWSLFSSPTIDDNKTLDGRGKGKFTSSLTCLNFFSSNDVYYIRAYATNENGTAYGNEVTINYENYQYALLPTYDFNGYIYRIYTDMSVGYKTYNEAWDVCQKLNFSGYNDWMLPTYEELKFIMNSDYDQERWEGWKYPDFTLYDGNRTSAGYWTRSYITEDGINKYGHGCFQYWPGAGTGVLVKFVWESLEENPKFLFRPVRKDSK